MEKLKAGIIGCGGIANGKHMPAIRDSKKFDMVAFCDIIVERAEKAAKEYGVPGAKVYEDYRKLLEDQSIDVVYVLTPNKMHSPITVDALDAGKHVMCEKPMAINYEEAKKMIDARDRSGKLLTIGYQNRYLRDSLYLKDVMDSGAVGNVYFAKAVALRRRAVPTWGVFLNEELQGGGPLIDIATHALDLTLWLMDNYKPKYVVGNTYHMLNKYGKNAANAFGDWNPEEFTVEDSAFGFVTMENGATITIESSWALNLVDCDEVKTFICGEKAGIDNWKGARVNGVEHGAQYVKTPNLQAGGVDFYEGGSVSNTVLEQLTLYNAITKGDELVVKPEQAIVVTQILDAIYKSDKEKTIVQL